MEGLQNFYSKVWAPDPRGYDLVFQIWLVFLETLKSRGYKVPPEYDELRWTDYISEYHIKLARFVQMYEQRRANDPADANKSFRQLIVDQYEHSTIPGAYCYVRFMSPSSGKHISKDQFKLLLVSLYGQNYKDIFIITSHSLASQVTSELMDPQYKNYKFFMDDELLVDPEKYYLSSPHTALSDEEAGIFYRENELSKSKMPQIAKNDKIVVKNGWLPGTLIRIDRVNDYTNGVATESVYHRVVSHNEVKKMKKK